MELAGITIYGFQSSNCRRRAIQRFHCLCQRHSRSSSLGACWTTSLDWIIRMVFDRRECCRKFLTLHFCLTIADPVDWCTDRSCHSLLAQRRMGIHQGSTYGHIRRPTSCRYAGQIQGSPILVVSSDPDNRLCLWYHRHHYSKHHHAGLVVHHRSSDRCFRSPFCEWNSSNCHWSSEADVSLLSSTRDTDLG